MEQHTEECFICFETLPSGALTRLNTLAQGCECNAPLCYRCILQLLVTPAHASCGNGAATVGFRCPNCKFGYTYALRKDATLMQMNSNPFRELLPDVCAKRTGSLVTLGKPFGEDAPDGSGAFTRVPFETFFFDDALTNAEDTWMAQLCWFAHDYDFPELLTNETRIRELLPPEHPFLTQSTSERAQAILRFCARIVDLTRAFEHHSGYSQNEQGVVDADLVLRFTPFWMKPSDSTEVYTNELHRVVFAKIYTSKVLELRVAGLQTRVAARLCHMPYAVYTFYCMLALTIPRDEFTMRNVLGIALRGGTDLFHVDRFRYFGEFLALYARVYLPVQHIWIETFREAFPDTVMSNQLFAIHLAIIDNKEGIQRKKCTFDAYCDFYKRHIDQVQLVCGSDVFRRDTTLAVQYARFMAPFDQHVPNGACWHNAEQEKCVRDNIKSAHRCTTSGHLSLTLIKPLDALATESSCFEGFPIPTRRAIIDHVVSDVRHQLSQRAAPTQLATDNVQIN